MLAELGRCWVPAGQGPPTRTTSTCGPYLALSADPIGQPGASSLLMLEQSGR